MVAEVKSQSVDTNHNVVIEAGRLMAQAEADSELADIKQREVDALRTQALRLRGRARHLEAEAARGITGL